MNAYNLAYEWNGTTWSTTPTPNVSGAGDKLVAVDVHQQGRLPGCRFVGDPDRASHPRRVLERQHLDGRIVGERARRQRRPELGFLQHD